MPKKISVNLSTMVDLKAELFRKQEQAHRQKQEHVHEKSSSDFVRTGKPVLYEARKAAAAQQKLQRQDANSIERRRKLEESEAAAKEEENQLARSKQRLEAKAALYEKLKSGGNDLLVENDSTEHFLVNFEQKAAAERSSSDESDDGDRESSDWVEYTDVLGRTRKCLRQDLPNFIAADEKLKNRRRVENEVPSSSRENASDLLSDDMRRDLKRKAWEKEEEEAAAQPKGPVHFQHLAEGESRELGVGYFPFASDEQTRQEQMQMLGDLRQQTISQRVRSEQLKEKRKAALKARLDKVKERKKLKAEDDAFLNESDDESSDVNFSNLDDIPLPESSATTTPLPKKSTAHASSAKTHVRPWDIGKAKVQQGQWIEKRRQERSNEFAPPSFY